MIDTSRLFEETTKYINGEDNCLELNLDLCENTYDEYQIRVIKRLIRAFDLYKNDPSYKNDYMIAIRDYLLVFNTNIRIDEGDFLNGNKYGISYDEYEKQYFASFQLPNYINDKLVKEAFLKNYTPMGKNNRYNLLSDSKIYSLTGYDHFKSMDQKLAVYGALNTPDGYTTLVSLPTGGGKSLITQTISYQNYGLTIVVVPTVSLAIDQERVTRKAIKTDNPEEEIFYYAGGVDSEPIIRAIKDKKAKIVFISPEALLLNEKFEEAISEANSSVYLKNIVIDEAHIVVDWGASFRVDYQCLEGWRNKLLITNPRLRTILLSATFEEECVATLKKLFASDDKWIEIRCDALRHEPRYCVIRTKGVIEKKHRIIDLVRMLPHPMIIYVPRPIDADSLKKMLSAEGINNVETFTGLTTSNKRKNLIEEWIDDKYSIMVATSAFGVGVDKPDVRTVLHTYIPQNANTYYQELGRGGRDKLPCLSVMCLCPEDDTSGRERIKRRVLTAEKIIRRWDSMYNNPKSKRISNNRVFIDTSIKPNYAVTDTFDDSPANDADMNWNIYVILFLRRHNMIRIYEVTIENDVYKILIEVVDDRLNENNQVLEEHINRIRDEEWEFYKQSYNTIVKSVRKDNQDCISELFNETYPKTFQFCAGCNAHNEPIVGDLTEFPLKTPVKQPLRELSAEQLLPFGNASEMVVFANKRETDVLIKRLIAKGTSSVIIPDSFDGRCILECDNRNSILVLGINEALTLVERKNYYYLSGLIVAVYPEDRNEIEQQYRIIKNNLCNKPAIRVVHVLAENVFLSDASKTFVELVDGPNISADVLYK